MSFRIQPYIKGVYLFALLAFLGVSIWFNPFPFFTDDPFERTLGLFIGVLSLMSFITGLWMGINLYALQKALLTITNDYIELVSINKFHFLIARSLRPFRFVYKEIAFIRTWKNLLIWEIVSFENKTAIFPPGLFGKDNANTILNELRKHLPANCLSPDLEHFYPTKQKHYKSRLIIGSIFLIIYLSTIALDEHFYIRTFLNNAWKVEMHSSDTYWRHSVDSPDNIWVITNDFGHPYRVYHRNGKTTARWELPRLANGDYPEYLSGDQNGNSIVWLEDRVLHYADNTWKEIYYDKALDISWYGNESVVSGEQGWFIAKIDEHHKFVRLHALTGEWQEIPLPEEAIQDDFAPIAVKQTLTDDLMVLLTNQSNARVYILSGDNWQKEYYPIIVSKNQFVQDYFLDKNGVLWALVGGFGKKQMIEKISSSGDVRLTGLKPYTNSDEDSENYDHLVVDSRERLWLSGGYPYFVAVFSPKWDETVAQIIVYSTKNSNYQGDTFVPPIYFGNGMIYSGDDYVSSINTNVEQLPDPLPGWVTRFDMNIVRLLIMIPYFIFVLISAYLERNPKYGKVKPSLS